MGRLSLRFSHRRRAQHSKLVFASSLLAPFSFKLRLIMAFFPSSSGLNIYDGNFMSFNFQTEDAGRSTKFFFPSLVIDSVDDTEYSHNGWLNGSVSMGDHRQASILFVLYYRFWRQATSSCVGNLSVTATTVIAYTPLPMEDVWWRLKRSKALVLSRYQPFYVYFQLGDIIKSFRIGNWTSLFQKNAC